MVTDKPPSCGAAKQELMPGVEHRRHKVPNSRAEDPRQPTRRREWRMQRFKSGRSARRFLSASGQIGNLPRLRGEPPAASGHQAAGAHAFVMWAGIGGVAAAA